MTKNSKSGLVVLLVAIVGATLAVTQANRSTGTSGSCCPSFANLTAFSTIALSNAPAAPSQTNALPKLLDLGAGKCIPCKMMAPILEELKKDYPGRLEVEFIDVWQNPDAGKQYGIEVIPTQIFYDGSGKELFRHIGFFAKADILAKWKELGVELK
ncbi:MAG: thioredoxin family protein [Limisphaerales bacterium]